ncbi:hypothetical protein HMI54_001665 [Coelomomyces lativittatus]|nr:hypothetical protein HMI55_000936 [Coelomomyces lativittatus]KAJ1510336.1 hypothetical protein HMI54_001665 [Coelomomyces lativittatus]
MALKVIGVDEPRRVVVTVGPQGHLYQYRWQENHTLKCIMQWPLPRCTRVMALASCAIQDHVVWGVGLSDGSVVLVQFHPTNASPPALIADIQVNRCVLCIQMVYLKHVHYVLIGTTAGELHVYSIDVNKVVQFETQISLHSAGLNCMKVIQKDDQSYLVLTGGDDNQLTVSVFVPPTLQRVWRCQEVCAASITQVIWVTLDTFLCVSLDRHLRYWKWRTKMGQFELKHSYLTSISDVADMSLRGSMLVIGGVGLEVLDLKRMFEP